jgi:hypothetical protein
MVLYAEIVKGSPVSTDREIGQQVGMGMLLLMFSRCITTLPDSSTADMAFHVLFVFAALSTSAGFHPS